MGHVSIIGHYEYVYGPGRIPNRKIEFCGSKSKNQIWAVFWAKAKNSWEKVGGLAQDRMIRDMTTTDQKIEIMIDARKNFKIPEYPPDKYFSQMPYKERVEVIKNLYPNGKYRITFTHNTCNNPFFETVTRLRFFPLT